MSNTALVARSSPDAASGDALVDYLQRVGKHYDEHIELLRRQKQLKEDKELTFKPTLTQRAYVLEKTSHVRRSEPIDQRLHHLHSKKLERDAATRAAKEREREAAEAQYTFTPQVSAYAASLQRPGTVEANDAWQVQREARLRVLEARKQAEVFREVTGVPTITAYAHEKAAMERPGTIPVEDLLIWREQQRQQRLYAAAQEQVSRRSANTSCMDDRLVVPTRPFEPSLSQHAAQLKASPDTSGSVVERLYRRPDATAANLFDETALHCTFRPSISPASQELSQLYYDDVTMRGVDPDVHGRLYANVAKQSRYRKDDVEVPSWRPTLSSGTRRILDGKKKDGEGDKSPTSRLHSTAAAHNASRKYAKPVVTPRDLEEASAYTYHPQVNPKSELLWQKQVGQLRADGRARNPDEARSLLWDRAQRSKEEAVQRRRLTRDAEERQECTFAPKAGRPPRRQVGGPDASLVDRTELWAQQREAKLAEARAEREEQEAAKYPFRPHVDPVFPLPRERSRRRDAPGVSSFLARQEEARRRREEVAHWWEPHHRDNRDEGEEEDESRARHGTTTPVEPHNSFSLGGSYETWRTLLDHPASASHASQGHRRAEEEEEEEEEEEAEYEDGQDVESALAVASSEESFRVHHRTASQSHDRSTSANTSTYADLPFRPVPAPPRMIRPSVMIEGSPVAAMLSRQRAALEEF